MASATEAALSSFSKSATYRCGDGAAAAWGGMETPGAFFTSAAALVEVSEKACMRRADASSSTA
jgi:hypothetical protein